MRFFLHCNLKFCIGVLFLASVQGTYSSSVTNFSPVPRDRLVCVSHTSWQTHVPRKCQIRVREGFRPLVVVQVTSVRPVRPCSVDQSKAQSFQNTSVISQPILSILRSLRGRLRFCIYRASGAVQILRASVFRCKRGSPVRCSHQSTIGFKLIYRIRC